MMWWRTLRLRGAIPEVTQPVSQVGVIFIALSAVRCCLHPPCSVPSLPCWRPGRKRAAGGPELAGRGRGGGGPASGCQEISLRICTKLGWGS